MHPEHREPIFHSVETAEEKAEKERAALVDQLAHLSGDARSNLRWLQRDYAVTKEDAQAEGRDFTYALPLQSIGLTPELLERRHGISEQVADTLVCREDFKTIIAAAEQRSKQRFLENISGRRKDAGKLQLQVMGEGDFGFSDSAVRLAKELEEGSRPSHELAPLPEKGVFQKLDDASHDAEPVRVYERQIIRTERDVESPGFSSCAAVVLYRRDAEGNPERETIFAHLPPKTGGMSGGPSSFRSYDPEFFAQQLGTDSLKGYSVRVCSGINNAPDEISRTLQSMGADVDFTVQLPLDMFTLRVDAATKTMVAIGKAESVVEPGGRVSYRTENGVPIVISDRAETLMEARPLPTM